MTALDPRITVDCSFSDALLEPLLARYPLAELFWRRGAGLRLALDVEGRVCVSAAALSGARLAVVAETASGSSWTSDLSSRGLARAFAALGIGVPPPPLPSRPLPDAPEPPWHAEQRWRNALSSVTEALRGHLGLGASFVAAQVDLVAEVRGAASAVGQALEWEHGRSQITVSVRDPTGRPQLRSRLLPLLTPWERPLASLVDDLVCAHRRAGRGSFPPGGMMPVVLAPGAGMAFFHEVVGHPLEADTLLAGQSAFSESAFDDLVSSPELTVKDEPSQAFGAGWIAYDDEGQPTRPVTLVHQGRLSGLLLDRVTATMTGQPTTGNGRRQDFRHPAEPRMRNISIAAGPHDPDALLSGIREGVYVERISFGRSEGDGGSLVLQVDQGRRIQQGVLGEPLAVVMLRGPTIQLLAAVEGVGRDVSTSPEPLFCTKSSTVATGLCGPTVRLGPIEVLT